MAWELKLCPKCITKIEKGMRCRICCPLPYDDDMEIEVQEPQLEGIDNADYQQGTEPDVKDYYQDHGGSD